MEKIQLHSVLPQVFAQREDLHSEIWKQDVTFEKGHLYLVEAGVVAERVLSAATCSAIVTTTAEA